MAPSSLSAPAFSLAATSVSGQTLAFENARLALRDGKPQDALRLWLLRNALESSGTPPTHDSDFRSVVWAALGETGCCADGMIEAIRRTPEVGDSYVAAVQWHPEFHCTDLGTLDDAPILEDFLRAAQAARITSTLM